MNSRNWILRVWWHEDVTAIDEPTESHHENEGEARTLERMLVSRSRKKPPGNLGTGAGGNDRPTRTEVAHVEPEQHPRSAYRSRRV